MRADKLLLLLIINKRRNSTPGKVCRDAGNRLPCYLRSSPAAPQSRARLPPHLLISQLQVVVGDPPVEVLHHVLADSVHGLRAQLLLHTRVHARRSPDGRAKEARLREDVPELMLVLAPQPTAYRGAPDLPVAAERPLHVPHHIGVVAAVERLHRVLVQEVEGLRESGAGCQQDR